MLSVIRALVEQSPHYFTVTGHDRQTGHRVRRMTFACIPVLWVAEGKTIVSLAHTLVVPPRESSFKNPARLIEVRRSACSARLPFIWLV